MLRSLLATAALFCAFAAHASSPSVLIDASALQAWLAASELHPDDPSVWNAASAATTGGRMAQAAIPSFGAVPKEKVAKPSRERVAALAVEISKWDVGALVRDVAGLFPPMPDRTAKVYVVANGIPVWADMYQRNFVFRNGDPLLSDEEGEPVILVNALLISTLYKGDAKTVAKDCYQVLRHELFHVFYAWYQASEPRRTALKHPRSQEEEMLDLTLNEGIAHFLASRDSLMREGFPVERAKKALRDLENALTAIDNGSATERLISQANLGPYWDKYAAISGMLFAYGIEKAQGEAGLKAVIAQGPASLLLNYARASGFNTELPRLSPALLAWAERNQRPPSGSGK
ncbi:DUF5700 domain-containing putative Zn-dependent protease [Niveibacterium terrae]|uniref:DUF5700 domain-containing putative Zn-dependent protease n=1 Tax=Niveibacterium terrae TaxID=3373598 RepID=UPI003A9218C2